jgi:penicillin-binding protein A
MDRQIRRLGVGLIVLYLALFVQLNVLQVFRADEYNNDPRNRRAVDRDFNEPRGQILDANGEILARSVAVDEGRFERQREYPMGALFGHVTGFFSFETGSDGVERSYNDALAGREAATSVRSVVDLLLDEQRTADVTLTIPASVQQVARDQLGERRGSVVALDPRDGSILALWSFPSYDPSGVSRANVAAAAEARRLLLAAEGNPLLPRSFRDTYFPGSTYKVVTGGAGLESGRVTAQTAYPVTSAYVPPLTNVPIRNGGRACGGDIFSIMAVSCNTAFAQMAVDMGPEAFVGGAEGFGFNDEPPLDLPRAEASTVADAASFDQNTPVLAQTGIGQNAVRATPLQMALVAAAVANNGSIMVPHVMAEVRDDEGRLLRAHEPTEWRRALTPENAAILRDSMVQVVERGTGRNLAIPGVATAGKTGSAQVRGEQPSTNAWMIGFAPVEAPRVAVAVLVEGPPGDTSLSGGRDAAPIARAVLEAALAETE